MAYGMAGAPGNRYKAGLPKGMGGFPAVGNGLGGLPVRRVASQAQTYWAAQFAPNADNFTHALYGGAVELGGSVFAVGRNAYVASQSAHFVSKFDLLGNPVFTRRNKDAASANVSVLRKALAHSGSLYVIGRYPGPSAEGSCIGKIDPATGNSTLLRVWPSSGTKRHANSFCRIGDSFIVAGEADAGPSKAMVQAYDVDLNITSYYTYIDSGSYVGSFLSVASDGTNAYACGYVSNASNEPYPAIVKVSPSGALVSQWRYPAKLYNVYVHDSSVVAGSYLYTMGENYIRQIDTANGNVNWEKSVGGTTSAGVTDCLAADASGNVYALFHNNATVRAYRVSKINDAGTCEWTTSIEFPAGIAPGMFCTGISVVNGAIFVSGQGWDTASRGRAILIKIKMNGTSDASGLNGLNVVPIAPIALGSSSSYSATASGGTYSSLSTAGSSIQVPTNEDATFPNVYLNTYATS